LGDIGGTPYLLSSYLKKLGVCSRVVTFREHRFKNKFDDNLDVDRYPRVLQPAVRLGSLLRNYLGYDVYHMHSCSWLPFYADAPLLKALGKKIVYHHHGHDVYVRIFRKDGSFAVKRKGAGVLTKFCDLRLVSTPDLLDAVPDAVYLPNPFDCPAFSAALASAGKRVGARREARETKEAGEKKRGGRALRIFHAPTDRNKKGTFFVEEAVKELRRDGFDVELCLCENKPREEFLSELKRSDVVVDQLNVGWYGIFAMEAMAAGKPVVVFIRPDLLKYIDGGIPFQNSSNRELTAKLRELLEKPGLRRKLGVRGKLYVKRVHDPLGIAKKLKARYEEILVNQPEKQNA